ncbi:efflux transporter outer membrane subunit [Lysobacter sp. A6]|uniref:Efflux transporter outer membrane subunit n=1 Tax=Noviluteimonas lactosilytica TaxID=2888523 RepID=A0ABS8JJH4_9GAMM|nr:efflux transporter outer membrane subunit [Lysobacter lactosilyticus]MCC8363752.1 efflux transporter outer membrane subunit [Lysobacter lactosilyticus]
MKRIAALACCMFLLAACMGPRPDPPPAANVVPPAEWLGPAATGAADLRGDWWRAFDDPVLDRLVEEAITGNVDLAIAAARVDEARAQFHFVEGLAGPDVAFSATGGRQRAVNAFGRGLTQTYGQAQVFASYEVDLFGRLRAASESARASLLATEEARDTLRLSVAATMIGGYITLRALDARLVLLHDTLEARGETLRLIRRRVDAGYGTRLELAQSEADYQAAAQAIPATQLAIARQEHALRVLLGDNPGGIVRGLALVDLRVAEPPPAGVPSSLLRSRPDIAQAEHQLVAADRSLDAARAAFLPRLQLSGSLGTVESNILRSGVDVFTLGASVLAPLFQRGKLEAQADAAAARRDQAAFAYRRTVIVAFREVEDALSTIQRSAEQEQALQAQNEAATAALELATKRYRSGYSPYLEQLDAQRAKLAGEILLIQARADRLTAIVSLHQSLGGGWTAVR